MTVEPLEGGGTHRPRDGEGGGGAGGVVLEERMGWAWGDYGVGWGQQQARWRIQSQIVAELSRKKRPKQSIPESCREGGEGCGGG